MHFGLIGCGGIGKLRAEALAQLSGVRLVAVNDLEPDRAHRLTAEHDGARVMEDWQGLVACKDVDVVIVSTPPSLHAEMTISALEAGKHVLCEKPLAVTVEEGQRMVRAAALSGRFLGTGFNYRFYPSIEKARELLDAGLIGRLDHIRSYTGYSASDHDHAWLHDAQVMGGGALRDNGIHLIDLTAHFLGDVAEVKGFGTNSVWQFPGCEDNGFALMRNAAGNIATLHASWTEWRGYRLQIELYGDRGCIRTSCFPMITHVLWSDELGGSPRRKFYLFPKTQIMEKLRSYRWVVVQSFVRELKAFMMAVEGRHSLVATGDDGLRAIEVAEMAVGQCDGVLPEVT